MTEYNNRWLVDDEDEVYLPVTSADNIIGLDKYINNIIHDSNWLSIDIGSKVESVNNFNQEYRKINILNLTKIILRFTVKLKQTDNKLGKIDKKLTGNKGRNVIAVNTTKNKSVILNIDKEGNITCLNEKVEKSDIIELETEWNI